MSTTTSPLTAAPEQRSHRPSRLRLFGWLASRAWTPVAVLLLLCAILFFYGLTEGELYRTESLRAIVAQQFLRSGNWMVPTLYGEPIFTKPPGMYAAIALCSWPFGGVREWTARLPSAIAATVAVFLFYGYFARQLGRLGGLVAAAILPASFMWLDKASAAEIDMLQVAWVVAALLCFLRALEIEEEQRPRMVERGVRIESWRVHTARGSRLLIAPVSPRTPFSLLGAPSPSHSPRSALWFWWLGALVCVAGGVLTKWTAPAFFYGTIGPLLWWRGRLRLLLGRHHLVSAAVCASLCLAWIGTAVTLTNWDSFYGTVSREAFMRLLPSHHYRPYPWLETLAQPFKLLLANLPWSAFVLWTWRPGFARLWDERGRRLLQALHCWIWPNLFFWSIIPEHAPRHSFPLFPAIAGLAAMVWLAWLTGRLAWVEPAAPRAARRVSRFLARPGTVLVGMLVCWLLVKVVFVEAVIPGRNQTRQPRAKGERLAALVPAEKTLYLSQLKDEGILFYYGRTAQRLESFEELHSSQEPAYCILDDSEWRHWWLPGTAAVVERMQDEQGDRMVLVKVTDIPR
jgi:4-amino-4-deoxy-L-arabinose transferase-like glycosyltransferase